jgi:hypothetical protein
MKRFFFFFLIFTSQPLLAESTKPYNCQVLIPPGNSAFGWLSLNQQVQRRFNYNPHSLTQNLSADQRNFTMYVTKDSTDARSEPNQHYPLHWTFVHAQVPEAHPFNSMWFPRDLQGPHSPGGVSILIANNPVERINHTDVSLNYQWTLLIHTELEFGLLLKTRPGTPTTTSIIATNDNLYRPRVERIYACHGRQNPDFGQLAEQFFSSMSGRTLQEAYRHRSLIDVTLDNAVSLSSMVGLPSLSLTEMAELITAPETEIRVINGGLASAMVVALYLGYRALATRTPLAAIAPPDQVRDAVFGQETWVPGSTGHSAEDVQDLAADLLALPDDEERTAFWNETDPELRGSFLRHVEYVRWDKMRTATENCPNPDLCS